MIEELSEYIQKNADSVSSQDIATVIKLAGWKSWAIPAATAAVGVGGGILGSHALSKRDVATEKSEADTKALLAGVAGLGAGYFVGKGLPSFGPSNSADLYADDQSLDYQDMDYIFGR
jgi:hypothetical protein